MGRFGVSEKSTRERDNGKSGMNRRLSWKTWHWGSIKLELLNGGRNVVLGPPSPLFFPTRHHLCLMGAEGNPTSTAYWVYVKVNGETLRIDGDKHVFVNRHKCATGFYSLSPEEPG